MYSAPTGNTVKQSISPIQSRGVFSPKISRLKPHRITVFDEEEKKKKKRQIEKTNKQQKTNTTNPKPRTHNDPGLSYVKGTG